MAVGILFVVLLCCRCKNYYMQTTMKTASVWFTTKGQVVIPAWLRKQFQIQNGTRAFVQATPEGILLKPVTKWAVHRGFGVLKRKPGGKSFEEEWAEHKHQELQLEEARHARNTGSR